VRVSLMQFVTDLTPQPQAVAAWAEERAFAGLYVPEKTHVPISRQTPWPGGELPDWYRRCYDPFVALAAAAAVTARLRIGTGACLVAVHDPILLAKQIASLSDMSDGRFVFGIGFGWNVEELADHGRAFDLIARHGDDWQPIEGYGELPPALPKLHTAFERAGRDPSTAQVCVYSSAGDPRSLDDYRAVGVTEVALTLPSAGRSEVLSELDRFAPLVNEFEAEMTNHA
jgi:alkanesulfonate monooxygenase SsuD/methylene tetrahydromethanopterin reductase-like flavin-dependent oxidoreductase (luciferase family)